MFVIVTYCHDITHINYNMISSQAATEREEQPEVKDLIRLAQRMTVVSWCTYPFVYIIPMFGAERGSFFKEELSTQGPRRQPTTRGVDAAVRGSPSGGLGRDVLLRASEFGGKRPLGISIRSNSSL